MNRLSIFRLGRDFAVLYQKCLIETEHNKHPLPIETKWEMAFTYTAEYKELSLHLVKHIFFSRDVIMLEIFLGGLHCVYALIRLYSQLYSQHCVTNMLHWNRAYFIMKLLPMYRRDCYALLCDIACYAEKANDYISETEDTVAIDTYCRLSHVIAEYLKGIKCVHPPFYDKPPCYVRCIRRSISRDPQML